MGHKLSEEQKQDVRERLAMGEMPDRIAAIYGVTPGAIYAYKPNGQRADPPPAKPKPVVRPHCMPWLTMAMLTAGRAP